VDREDEVLQLLIPAENFMELAAWEAEMMDLDWDGLLEVVIAALATLDSEILAEAQLVTGEWENKPEGLEWHDGLG
jgi:hypothetical protein